MTLLSGVFYFIGLICISVTIANLYISAYGFLIMGGGVMLFPVIHALICMVYRKAGMRDLL